MEVRKGFNFRFSVREMDKLDWLAKHMAQNPHHYLFWGQVTRTDVLRYLLTKEVADIEERCAKLKADAEKIAQERTKKNSRSRKAVKK